MMDGSLLETGCRYINNFGTTYVVHAIEGDVVIYTIEGLRMKPLRMHREAFAHGLVREIPG
ncbi:hypothetical protein LH464_21250 [Neorhizobium sp. T786]|uniref:hypothetical protein n=1 Tax=Pseudorhizobium xiangyangii TaxID=2883104 RepID=UPI001CFF9CB6|nr:hypothetical protein [Neorhizobium xiangyangii]MCB5204996.1 hypothetical protein [Neorhizobium xiangyangii]